MRPSYIPKQFTQMHKMILFQPIKINGKVIRIVARLGDFSTLEIQSISKGIFDGGGGGGDIVHDFDVVSFANDVIKALPDNYAVARVDYLQPW